MSVLVLCVGRLKEDFWEAAEAEYQKRLRRYADVKVREVKDEAALVAAIPPRASLVALDRRGDLVTSEALAREILAGLPQVAFAIGGAEGLGDELRARARRIIAFGRITLPHRLARVLLLEQIYRGFSILRGDPYHK
ncbi:MAG TPA: 23S rRNA (pseudouridine(1915)-N(3))-methyltransferase RlmH [Haliangiales bacterium]|nr:23S rRNA (pseudouridine(1915)-N(3))-methyltransferase RlmH [Haliangiales bacterium]